MNSFINQFGKDIFPIILILLLPMALVSGPAIPDIILSILGLIFLVKSFKEKLFYFYYNIFSLSFFLFFFIILLSGLSSGFIYVSLIENEAIFYFRFYLFSLAICYFCQRYPVIFKYLGFSLFITIIVITIDGSVEYMRGVSIFGVKSGETRLFSLFIDEPIVGRYISSATMLCVSLFIYHFGYKDNKKIIFIFSILMIGEVFTFMTGERAAFGMIAIFSISSFILISERRVERIIFIILSIICIAILINQQDRTKQRFDQTVSEIQNREFNYIAASPIHDQHYSSAIKMFIDKPILGVGSNLFRSLCKDEDYIVSDQSCSTHPHHYYIQILAENGILGFIIFCFVPVSLIIILTKHFFGLIFKNQKLLLEDKKILFYIFLFVVIFPFWPSGSFYNNWTNVTNFIGLGFLLSFHIKLK